MGKFWKTFSNFLREKKDQSAQALSDPVRDGRYAVEDSEKRITQFESKMATLMAETKRLEPQKADADADVQKYLAAAEKAVEAGGDEDARKLLEAKAQAQARSASLQTDIDGNRQLVAQLRDELGEARARVARAKSNLTQLAARHEAATVRKELAKAASDFGTGESPLTALDDLQRSVDAEETEAEALEELASQQTTADEVAAQYEARSAPDIEAELAKLKAQKGK